MSRWERFINGFWLWLETMVEPLSQSMNNVFLKLDFTKSWKVDERNQNIGSKNLEYVAARFLFFMVLSSGQQQEFIWFYMNSVYVFIWNNFLSEIHSECDSTHVTSCSRTYSCRWGKLFFACIESVLFCRYSIDIFVIFLWVFLLIRRCLLKFQNGYFYYINLKMSVCELLFTLLVIKRNLHLSVNLTFVGPSMRVIGGFWWNVGMWSLHHCSSH